MWVKCVVPDDLEFKWKTRRNAKETLSNTKGTHSRHIFKLYWAVLYTVLMKVDASFWIPFSPNLWILSHRTITTEKTHNLKGLLHCMSFVSQLVNFFYLQGTSHNILSNSIGEVCSESFWKDKEHGIVTSVILYMFQFRPQFKSCWMCFTSADHSELPTKECYKSYLFNVNVRKRSSIMICDETTRTVNSPTLMNQHVATFWINVICNYKTLGKSAGFFLMKHLNQLRRLWTWCSTYV